MNFRKMLDAIEAVVSRYYPEQKAPPQPSLWSEGDALAADLRSISKQEVV